jgi:hypothetical protein
LGGWNLPSDSNDRIYLTTTNDRDLRQGFSTLTLVADVGYYSAVNDPSVVRKDSQTWAMALSVVNGRRNWVAVSNSQDGITWPKLTNSNYEVAFTGGTVSEAVRPSLVYNSSAQRWELYCEASVNGVYGQYLAYCSDTPPKNFALQGTVSPVPWFDADIKRVGNSYIAAYRRNTYPEWPWQIWYGQSSDGRKFTEVGVLLAPDPLASYNSQAVTNPGWVIDANNNVRAVMFGGASTTQVDNQKIGIAYPQQLVQAQANTGAWLNQRQALNSSNQLLYAGNSTSINWVKVSNPGTTLINQQVKPSPKGSVFSIKQN